MVVALSCTLATLHWLASLRTFSAALHSAPSVANWVLERLSSDSSCRRWARPTWPQAQFSSGHHRLIQVQSQPFGCPPMHSGDDRRRILRRRETPAAARTVADESWTATRRAGPGQARRETLPKEMHLQRLACCLY